MVKTRTCYRVGQTHTVINNIHNHLQSGRNNRAAAGEPVTSNGLPSLRTIVGVIELSMRLPGSMAFASRPIRPKALGLFFGGKIVHFIVQRKSCASDHHLSSHDRFKVVV